MKKHPEIQSPAKRLAIIAPLLILAASVFAQSGTWTSLSGGSWTNSVNWSGGTVATNLGNTADFSTLTLGSSPTVTLDGARTIGNLTFGDAGNTYNWTLNTGSGGPLTLGVSAGSPWVTVNNRTTTIGAALAGTAGLAKLGAGTLALTGANTYSGNTYVSNGIVSYTGNGGSSGGGTLFVGLASGNVAVVNLGSSGTVNFYTTFNVGNATGSSGAVNQSSGTVNAINNGSYIQVGSGGYGAYVLSGGTLNIPASSGLRVGYGSAGTFLQTGGFLNSGRYVAVGGNNSSGNGVATFTGGAALVSSGFRFLVPDAASANGTLNIGTEAGGTSLITNLTTTGVVMENSSGGNGIFNLNSGTLQIAGPIFRNNLSGGSVAVNFNGGTLQAGAASVTLLAASITNATVYNGGLAVDSLANTATLSGPLLAATGNGVYPAGGAFAISSGGGSGYIGAPLAAVTTSGSGTGATAIANVSGGVVTGVTMTCPGKNYAAGDTLTFTFTGGGFTSAASTFIYTLTANDLSVNALGGLTKNGSGTLNLTVANTYTGNTTVNAGTLNVSVDGGLGSGNVVVANNATLSLSGGVTNGYLAATANLVLGASATAGLNFTGTNTVNGLSLDGGATYVAAGTYGPAGSPAVTQDAHFTGTGVINVTAQPAGATVALVSSANPSEYAQSVTLTAAVSGSSGLPTGTVTFRDGGAILATVTLNGSGAAAYSSTAFAIAAHAITATYNGNATYSSAANFLTQTVTPRNDIWSGVVNNVWDVNTTANWLDLGSAAKYHDTFDLARLDDTATGSTDISLGVTVQPYAVVVTNNVKNYSLSGAGAISGTGGLVKLGAGTLTVSNANSYTGNTTIEAGTLNFNGSAASSGSGALNVSNGVVNLNTSGTLTYGGFASVGGISGNGSDAGSAVVNQNNGTLNLGANSTYLELGAGDGSGTATSYGCYNLAGGSLNTINASGVRVGASGFGVFRQTGGTLNSSRYFVVGTGTGGNVGVGTGEATFLGGSAVIGSGFRIILGDTAGTTGVLNLGTEAGGNAVIASSYNSGGKGLQLAASGAGTLNLNRGTLQLAGSIYQTAAGTLNFNGGTLQASNNMTLVDGSVSAAYAFNGGAVIDSQGFTITNSANLQAASGNGIYPASGSIAVTGGGGSGYLGAPLVAVSGGTGFGALAIANVSGGVVTSVALTCPGQSYQAGDSISFAFTGGGAATPASTFNYTLQAGDVAANNGGLTKVGNGTLVLNGNNSYTGPTVVQAGTLVLNSGLGNSAGAYIVTNGTTLNVGVGFAGSQLNLGSLAFAGPAAKSLTLDLSAAGSLTAAPVNDSGTLTANGTTTINLLISGIAIGQYQLIQFGSLAGTGGFALGSLPIGVQAHLVTNTTASPNSIDLVVTSSGQPRWNGTLSDGVTVNGTWDINTTANWIDVLTTQYEPYKEGQPVLFDDNATGTTTVNLIANVHPGSVTFNNTSLAYTLGGANKISGLTGLTVQGSGTVTIQNALNDYTGVTTIGGGTLNVTNLANGGQPSAIGAAAAAPANLVFTNNGNLNYSGPAVAINRGYTVGAGGGTLTANANITLSGQAAVAASGSFTKAGPATLTYNGAVNNQLGATNNIADGAVVLDGSAGTQSNSVTGLMLVGSAGPATASLVVTNTILNVGGSMMVDYGTANLSAGSSLMGSGTLNVGNTPGAISILNVADNATVTVPSATFIGGAIGSGVLNLNSSGVSALATNGSLYCVGGAEGGGDSGAGVVNQTAGTVNFAAGASLYLELGAGGGGAYGAYNLSGGAAVEPSGVGVRVGAGGYGVFTQTGGTLSCGRYFAIGTIAGSVTAGGQGVATFTGGTATIDNGFRIILGDKSGSTAMLNVGTEAGGVASVTALGATPLQLLADNAASSAVLNLNRGTLQLGGSIYKNTGNTSGTDAVNLNGGTLQAGANNVTLANNTLDSVNLYNGGVIVDSQTNTATISANLLATTGNGVYPAGGTLTVTSGGGSGYLGAPLVAVTGGSGTGATAIANVTGGVVTGVAMTCPGQGYVAGDTLNFSFTGGGTANPANQFSYTLQAGDLTANGSGGFTKTGKGSLTLSGTNTYPGTTVVSNGTLTVNGGLAGGAVSVNSSAMLNGNGVIAGVVTVQNGGTLASGGTAIGVLTINNALTFAPGATNFARLNKSTGTNDSARGLSQVNYAGTLVVTNLSGTLAAGDKFTLFSAGVYSGNFSTLILPALSSGLGWSNSLAANGSIQIVATVNPNPTNIVASVSGNALTLSWPADHTGWTLLAQTNGLTAGLGTNWSPVAGSTGTNSVTVSIDPSQPTVFYRLKY